MNDLTTSQIKGIWVDLAFHERRASMYRDILGLPPAAESVNADLLAACKAARTTIECTLDDKEARGDAVNWEAANRILGTLRAAIADAERGAS